MTPALRPPGRPSPPRRAGSRFAPRFALPLGLLALLAAPAPAAGQAPRFGIALSGGSARGLAHVGALQVLEDAGLAPDLVTGSSMGAVVGGLYASGISADSLASLSTTANWAELLTGGGARPTLSLRRRLQEPELLVEVPVSGAQVVLPTGVVTGQQVGAFLSRMTWAARNTQEFGELPTPFAAVATDLGTGNAVRMQRGSLAQAIRASLSLPSVFVPVRSDGRLLVDALLARNLPAVDARALGADVLACVDVGTPIADPDDLVGLPSIFLQSLSLLTARSDSLQTAFCDVVITPDLEGYTGGDFAEADTLIALGAAAMREALPRLQALLAGRVRRERVTVTAVPDTARFVAVRVESDGGRLPEDWVRAQGQLDAAPGEPLSLDAAGVAQAVSAIYGTEAFETVLYGVRPGPEGDTLVLSVRERPNGRAGAGLRFDTANRLAVVARLRYDHLLRPGTSLGIGLRLGRELGASGRLEVPLGYVSPYSAALEAGAGESYRPPAGALDPTEQDTIALAPFNTSSAWVEAALLRRFGQTLALGVRGRAESFLTEPDLADAPGDGASYVSAGLALSLETLDDVAWPRRGHALYAQATTAAGVGDQGGFQRVSAEWRGYFILAEQLTLLPRAAGGWSGGDVPPHLVYRAGGVDVEPPGEALFDFAGYTARSLQGRTLAVGSVGVRWEPMPARYLTVRAAAGGGEATGRLRRGYALSVGADSPLGPAELTLMSPDDLSPIRWQFAIGYRF